MRKTAKYRDSLPVVYLSWEEACAIDFDEIGFVQPPEDEVYSTLANGHNGEDASELVHIFPKPPPKIIDLSSVDAQIKKYTDACISSGFDPLAKHGFYVKVEELLYEAQDKGLISSNKDELDSLWIKYDQWAHLAHDPLQAKNTSQFVDLANDIFKFAPHPPGRTPYHRRKCSNRFFRNTKWKRGSKKNLQPVVKHKIHMTNRFLYEFIKKANDSGTNIRDNLSMRREFFDKFPHFIDKAHEPFMDFYWNALFHRKLEYYEHVEEKRQEINERRKQEKERVQRKSVPQRGRALKNLIPFNTEIPVILRSLDVDRIVRQAINDCIFLAKDPLASHHFYWTCHLALAAKKVEVGSNVVKKNVRDEFWDKWDTWADKAWNAKSPLIIEEDPEQKFYKEVKEVPLTSKKELTSYPSPDGSLFVETRIIKRLSTISVSRILEKSLRKIIRSRGGDFDEVDVRRDLRTRRRFMDSYAGYVHSDLDGNVVDEYWRRLLTEKREDYEGNNAAAVIEEVWDEEEEETVVKTEVEQEDAEGDESGMEIEDVEIKQEVESD